MTFTRPFGKPNSAAALLLSSLGTSLVMTPAAVASGFVKSSGQGYTKLQFTSESGKEVKASPRFQETGRTYSLYSEWGLPTPFRSQISASTSLKQVERKNATDGSFLSRGLGDSSLEAKVLAFEGPIGSLNGEKFTLYLSPSLGVTLPTTKEKFRTGNESKRAPSLEKSYLVAPLGDGKSKIRSGLGLSVLFGPVWLSSDFSLSQTIPAQVAQEHFGSSLGTALPMNSWLQFRYSQTRKNVVSEAESKVESFLQVDSDLSASFGWTFWSGLALEGSYGQNAVAPKSLATTSRFWSVGLSHRDL
jgi:hypothetical protein